MKLANALRSTLLPLIVSERSVRVRRKFAEAWRRLLGKPHVVSVFVELDDPYSYLLCHYLSELERHYDIELRYYLTEAVAGVMRPAPHLYAEYVIGDAGRLARELGIPFLDRGPTPPVEQRRALLAALASEAGSEDFAETLNDAMSAYWRGDTEAVTRRAESGADVEAADSMVSLNQRLLKKMGHYNTAMLHYAGEWYWGVDRLHYLTSRLDALGAAREAGLPPRIASIRQVMHLDLPIRPPDSGKDLPPLELFFSFRSPYSYLALARVFRTADAFGVRLKLRPVLPMVMRGMKVPRSKMIYIMHDAGREARDRDVDFGDMADPVGAGVERCLAVLFYAMTQNRGREFALHASRAIWARGVDVSTDKGLRKVTGRAGLFWPDVVNALNNDEWRAIVEENRAEMMEAGSWGVPTMRIGDWLTWGQDRDWLLARHLEDMCDSGDGILV